MGVRQVFEQDGFEDAELGFQGAGFEQALAKRSAIASPDLIEFDELFAGFGEWKLEKWPGAAEAKAYGHEAPHLARVDDGGLRMRAAENRAVSVAHDFAIRAVIGAKRVFFEIDHHVDAPAGEDAFESHGKVAFVVGDGFDERRERRRARANRNRWHGYPRIAFNIQAKTMECTPPRRPIWLAERTAARFTLL